MRSAYKNFLIVLLGLLAFSGVASAASGLCVKGQAVSVLYAGQWYPAKVLDGPDNMDTCLISYDGSGSNWDEWVNAQRMRPALAAAKSTEARPAAQPKGSASVPAGKYNCYTFDSGRLNYAYTDVVIHDASRYSVGDQGGTYKLAGDGAMSFTGTMSNAVGKFSVKNTGKPQIDLIFNDDPRASMACSRAG